jgi:hypothetical protein
MMTLDTVVLRKLSIRTSGTSAVKIQPVGTRRRSRRFQGELVNSWTTAVEAAMAEIRPDHQRSEPDISDAEIRKLIRKVNRDLDKLERAAQALENATRPQSH